jgi:hypothetical protein
MKDVSTKIGKRKEKKKAINNYQKSTSWYDSQESWNQFLVRRLKTKGNRNQKIKTIIYSPGHTRLLTKTFVGKAEALSPVEEQC